jgi:hypothetical protein
VKTQFHIWFNSYIFKILLLTLRCQSLNSTPVPLCGNGSILTSTEKAEMLNRAESQYHSCPASREWFNSYTSSDYGFYLGCTRLNSALVRLWRNGSILTLDKWYKHTARSNLSIPLLSRIYGMVQFLHYSYPNNGSTGKVSIPLLTRHVGFSQATAGNVVQFLFYGTHRR